MQARIGSSVWKGLKLCLLLIITEIFTTLSLKPQLHRQCDCDGTSLWSQILTIVKWLQRTLKGFNETTTRSPTSHETKSVVSCLLSMHKRQATTDLVASVNLSAADQWWGGDWSALHHRLVAVRLQSGFHACAAHSPLGLQKSPTCLHHLSFTSTIFLSLTNPRSVAISHQRFAD